eukprot:2194125-Rhodomonas_salina.5
MAGSEDLKVFGADLQASDQLLLSQLIDARLRFLGAAHGVSRRDGVWRMRRHIGLEVFLCVRDSAFM